MLSRRAKSLLLACGVCAAVLPAVAVHAGGTLPPGFGDPGAAPKAPPPPTTPTPTTVRPETETPVVPVRPVRPEPQVQETTDSALTDLEMLPPAPPPPLYDIPVGSERSTDIVGLINVTNRGVPIDAFGDAGGAYLATLMQRLDAPIPSRWAQILLRRALMSRVTAPRGIDPADFVAARVRLLVRMGEADAARMLAQAIDVVSYTPMMVGAAYEASLASADPAGLCPLVQKGRESFDDPAWPMADAMCAAMQGEPGRAGAFLDEARRKGARGIDLLLAEKIVGAGSGTGRSVEINWDEVPELNVWRFGLASAAGVVLPERLIGPAGARMQAWLARAPMVPAGERLGAADAAATLGVFSSASLMNAHALAFDMRQATGEAEAEGSLTSRLAAAFNGEPAGRVVALRGIWGRDSAAATGDLYPRLILTAGAVAQLAADGEYSNDADEIVASLLAAGMDGEAAAWTDIVEGEGGSSLGWALLAVGAPRLTVDVDGSRIRGFAGADGDLRARMLAAALAGLGRMDDNAAVAQGIDVARTDAWTEALDRAASAGQGGTVALLVAVGMQVPDWRGVPPEHLYHITRALRRVGLEYEARMIAAEALTRL